MTAQPAGVAGPLADVLARATDEAVRLGHGRVTAWHLVRVLAGDPAYAELLGPQLVTDAAMQLSQEPRTYLAPVPTEGALQAVRAASPGPDPVRSLVGVLRGVAGGAPVEPVRPPAHVAAQQPTVAASGARLSAVREQYAHVVLPGADLVARPEIVDQVVASMGAGRTPLVVGPEGSGRTTLAALLAARLSTAGYTGPLTGSPVVLVRAGDAVVGDTAVRLQELLVEVGDRCVVVLDDLEVLAALGAGGRVDEAVLTVVRGAVDNPARRVVLVLSSSYAAALSAAAPELVDECVRLDIPAMPTDDVRLVTQRHVRSVSSSGVTVEAGVVEAATAPARSGDVDTHPALAVRRVDHAVALGAVRGDRVVRTSDVLPPEVRPVFAPDAVRAGLARRIVGQDEVLDRVVRRLSVTRAELDVRPTRPDGVLLFAGPTGTGKTALAQAIAVEVLGTDDALVRLDMSEYSEPQSVAKLVGSPPGYVGSTEPSSWLTTRILARPECVLLLDEVEKADPVVWNTFLQVFDAGRLSDGLGRTADFRRTIVVLTTNIGARVFEGRTSTTPVDPATDEAAVLTAVKERMAPELVNRLDDVLVFRPLTLDAVREIARRMLDDVVVSRMAARGYTLSYADEVVELVASAGYDPAYGARPVQRALENLVVLPLASCPPGAWHAEVEDGHVDWRAVPA